MNAISVSQNNMEEKIMREVFGETLAMMGDKYPNLVVLGADAIESTRANLFAEKYPERSFNFGIAEQEMMSAAAGFALCGKIPLVAAYGFLISMRACEQVRTDICYPNLNVKLAATHTGLSMGPGGTTHHSTEDVAIMRSFANMTVIAPADGLELAKAVDAAILHQGPVYLRVGRGPTPPIFSGGVEFEIGKATIIRDGTDVALISYGYTVSEALGAAELLAQESIEARVINMSTIKPLDEEAVIKAAKETGAIVTAENNSIIGGLGEAVAAVLAENIPTPMVMVGVEDEFSQSGRITKEVDELKVHFRLGAEDVASAVKECIAKKNRRP